MKRYEVRAKDKLGDLGILAGRYWFHWRAVRHLHRAEHQREEAKAKMDWDTHWTYYIKTTGE